MAKILLCVALSLAFTTRCFAHDTWLSPSTYSADVGQAITFDLTSGMEFPTLDSAVKPERVAKAGFRVGSDTGELKEFTPAEHALRFERSFSKPGVATVWLQLSPKDIELSDEDVAHYLEEARAPEDVQRAWAAQKGHQKWKELYTKCAKTCLVVGKAGADRAWSQPVGMALEFVPLSDPATLGGGETGRFKLLRNGAPLAGAAVALHRPADKAPVYQTTDAEGVVSFSFAEAGPAMLATVYLRPPDSGGAWQSEFSTLTIEVKPK